MNVAVKPWRCHLSAGSPGWDAERRLCSTWMHGCAECRAADPDIASFQPQQQYWDLVLAPATDRVTLQGLATAHTSIKMWQAYYSSVHTHLGYFVTDCPIFILLLEHVRRPSKFDGSQRKGQKKTEKRFGAYGPAFTNAQTSIHPHHFWGDWCDSGKPQTSLRSSGRFNGKAFLCLTESNTPTNTLDAVLAFFRIAPAVRCGANLV